MTLTVYADDQATADEAADACEQRVRELDELLAPDDAGSEIAQLNAAGGDPFAVSDQVRFLVTEALGAARESNGAFDPTVYPLTSAWGFTTGDHRVPSPEEIGELRAQVGYQFVQVDDAARMVTLGHGTRIDVGGVAKGYAADELWALLNERGIDSALFDLGGNVTALGAKPDGSVWKVGIADPAAPDQLAGTLDLVTATVSTSGAYQRFFDEGGVRYHHLLDPATGYPTDSDLASVSVVGGDGARCDALSTACYVLGREGALELWRRAGAGMGAGGSPFDLVLIADDGSVTVTEGIADAFKPAGAYGQNLSVVKRP